MSPADVEIRYVSGDDIYDLFVKGRFKNFYKTFGEAVMDAEKELEKSDDVIQQWKEMPPKKGKVRCRK